MNIKNISFKKIISHIKGDSAISKKGLYRPHKDWVTIIVIFFVLLVLSVGIHYALYFFAEQGAVFNKTAEQEMFNATLRKDTIEGVVKLFDNKVINIESFNNNRATLVDPS